MSNLPKIILILFSFAFLHKCVRYVCINVLIFCIVFVSFLIFILYAEPFVLCSF